MEAAFPPLSELSLVPAPRFDPNRFVGCWLCECGGFVYGYSGAGGKLVLCEKPDWAENPNGSPQDHNS